MVVIRGAHKTLPVIVTDEFDFWRCVEFNENFYGITVSELFKGNLRESNKNNRYSSLFPNQKLSYWASSKKNAHDEIIKHGSSKNIISFWAYDDATSTYPTLSKKREPLVIVEGTKLGFETILKKVDDGIEINEYENNLISRIIDEKPDCIAYQSFVNDNEINFYFLKKDSKNLHYVKLN